jgi:putative transposase
VGVSSEESAEVKRLRRENAELRRASEIFEGGVLALNRSVQVGFLREGARPSTATLVTFITEYQDRFGVEPICAVLTEFGVAIAPSTYYAALTRPKSWREIEDEKLMTEIQRVYDENYRVYGARKVWHQLNREGVKGGAWPGGTVDAPTRLGRRPFAARLCAPRSRTRTVCGPRTWCDASSRPVRRTGCG